MNQPLPMLNPDQSSAKPKFELAWLVFGLLFLLILMALWLWNGQKPAIQAVQALVEAQTIALRAPQAGLVQKVLVREGQAIQPGQILLVFDDNRAQLEFLEAQAGYQAVQNGLNPGLPQSLGLEQALEELRLAADARQEQEAQIQQQLVLWSGEQAAALLALRNPTASQTEQAAASAREREALNQLTNLRQQQEDLVRERQNLENQIQALRNLDNVVVDENLVQVWHTRLQLAEQALEQSTLRAPGSGRVNSVLAQAGLRVTLDEIVLTFLPDADAGASAYWVSALFANADAHRLFNGASCRVDTGQGATSGKIVGLEFGQDFVLARIELDAAAAELGLEPGQAVKVMLD